MPGQCGGIDARACAWVLPGHCEADYRGIRFCPGKVSSPGGQQPVQPIPAGLTTERLPTLTHLPGAVRRT